MSAYLRYIGNGSWLPDTPARDLNEEEAKYYGVGRLIDSHLYEFANSDQQIAIGDQPKAESRKLKAVKKDGEK